MAQTNVTTCVVLPFDISLYKKNLCSYIIMIVVEKHQGLKILQFHNDKMGDDKMESSFKILQEQIFQLRQLSGPLHQRRAGA